MPLDPPAETPESRVYSVWAGVGEAIIVQGREPMWASPGVAAELLAEIEAESYEAACAEWNARVAEKPSP